MEIKASSFIKDTESNGSVPKIKVTNFIRTTQQTQTAVDTQDVQGISTVQTDHVEQNSGGVIGGLGYLGEKIAVGFMSSVEGIWDYAAGGLAKLFGADDWAEQQFANDWFGDWYSHPEEWFNPSGAWKTAGAYAGIPHHEHRTKGKKDPSKTRRICMPCQDRRKVVSGDWQCRSQTNCDRRT